MGAGGSYSYHCFVISLPIDGSMIDSSKPVMKTVLVDVSGFLKS